MAQVQHIGNPAPQAVGATESRMYGTQQSSLSGSFQPLKPRPCGQPSALPQHCSAQLLPPSPASPPQQHVHQQGPLGAAYAAASLPSAALNFSPASSGAVTGPCTPAQSAGSLRLATATPKGEWSQGYASPTGSLTASSVSSLSSSALQPGHNFSPMPAGSQALPANAGSSRVAPGPAAVPSRNTLTPMPSPFSGDMATGAGKLGTVPVTRPQPALQQPNPIQNPPASAARTALPASPAASFREYAQPAAFQSAQGAAGPAALSGFPSSPAASYNPSRGAGSQPAPPVATRQVELRPSPALMAQPMGGQQQQQQQHYPQPGMSQQHAQLHPQPGQQHSVGLPRSSPMPEQHHKQYVFASDGQQPVQPYVVMGHSATMPAARYPAEQSVYPSAASGGASSTAPLGASSGLGYGQQEHYPAAASGPVPTPSATFSAAVSHQQQGGHTPHCAASYHACNSYKDNKRNGNEVEKWVGCVGAFFGACLVGACKAMNDD